ncbi:MAG: hypothetical protein ACHWZW_04540 [Spirulina sp.]
MTLPMSSPSSDPKSADQSKADLLSALVTPSPIYPWEPNAPEAEPYFATATATVDDGDALIHTALAEGWQRFSAQLNNQWGQTSESLVSTILQQLKARLQSPPPDEILQTIAITVTALRGSGQTYLAQIVTCAQAVLPTWDAEDLAVLARPLAYSLRDGHSEILDLNLRSILKSNWQSLSEIEQARLSLTLAALALRTAAEED